MIQTFDVLSITQSLIEKKIIIECSMEVKPQSVSKDLLELTDKVTKEFLDYDIAVNLNFIELQLKEWPVPNQEYLLRIQKGITSVVDDELEASLRRNIVFLSDVTSEVIILQPANFEQVDSLSLQWQENVVAKEMVPVNSYYLEVATDNAFYNVTIATTVFDKQNLTLTALPNGQYYIRVRAQNSLQYGPWSDVTTFVLAATSQPIEPVYGDSVDSPIYEEDLKVVSAPANNETPTSFIIKFDEPIDEAVINSIVVTRRPIQ